ncbi:MAG TPA: GYF domain-containing protein [Vicinamibacteria bacterium]|nr:GYF domain-containing protein [Vicinamibacteria bacterium]
MSDRYLLHLPDGTEYGPVDRATLEEWTREGRVPAQTLVWREGSPEWVSLEKAFEGASEAAPPAAAAPDVASTVVEPAPSAAPAAPAAPARATTAAPPGAARAAATARHPGAAPARASGASPASTPTAEPSGPAASSRARPATPRSAPAPAPAVAPAAAPAASAVAAAPGPPASTTSSRPTSAPTPADDRPDTVPKVAPARRPRDARSPQARPSGLPPGARTAGLALVGIAVVAGILVGLWALLRPFIARQRAIAEVQRYALPDRRIEDAELGLSIDLPPGWVALRPENPFVGRPGARARLANAGAGVFGAIFVAVRPAFMDDLDGHLAELLQERLPRQPSQKEGERSDVQLGRGKGRLVRTTWDDGFGPMQGGTVAWADGYDLFSLEAWAKASTGPAFTTELLALCQGVQPMGKAAARIDEAVERLALQVPELSRDTLRLLVAERLSEGRGLEDVPSAALRMVSRGLDALGAAEAAEMRAIYQQVWAPVPEAERVRLAGLMNEIKAGRPVRDEDLLALRTVVQAGVLALPEEQRARLQELSARAVRQSLLPR